MKNKDKLKSIVKEQLSLFKSKPKIKREISPLEIKWNKLKYADKVSILFKILDNPDDAEFYAEQPYIKLSNIIRAGIAKEI